MHSMKYFFKYTTVLILPFIPVMSLKACENIKSCLEEKANKILFSPLFSVGYRTGCVSVETFRIITKWDNV